MGLFFELVAEEYFVISYTTFYQLICNKMGACESVDEKPDPYENYIPRNSNRRNTSVELEELQHNTSMEDFLSKYRMRIHCNTDPLARSSVMTEIVSEFKQEFDREVNKNTIYDYYGCSW